MPTSIDRSPVKLSLATLGASATAYYPLLPGYEDRLKSTDLIGYVRAQCWADVSGTFSLDESHDNVTWAATGASVTVSASTWTTKAWTLLTKRYWRWTYVNDGTAQTAFHFFEDRMTDARNIDIGDVDILTIAAGDNNIGNVDIASIAAGDTNIGNVDVLTIAAGDNNIGNVDVVTEPATVANAGTIPAVVKVVGGYDGANVRALKTDASGEAQVDVLTIAAGDNNIGNVDIATIAAGDNNIGNVDIASAIPAGDNNIGNVDIASAIPAGANIIGQVGIDQTTPGTTNGVQVNAALPAGDNNIGNVDVLTIAAGDNNIGNVDIATIAAGDNNIGNVDVASIAAGDNNIGNVDIASAIPAGTNLIGKVDLNSDFGISSVSQDSSANSAQTITVAAVGGQQHYVVGFEVAISAAAAGADIAVTLADGGTTKWKEIIGSGAARGTAVGIVFSHPIVGTVNTAMTLTAAAGGTNVVTSANLAYYTK